MATLAHALQSGSRSIGLVRRAVDRAHGRPVTEHPELRLDVLVAALNAAGVQYIVIGGVAMAYWDARRLTVDLDVCYALDRANCRALARVLRELNARPEGATESRLRTARLMAIQLDTDAGPLDLLAVPDGTSGYEDLAAETITLDIGDGLEVRIPTREAMLRMKRAAGRPSKDATDIAILAGEPAEAAKTAADIQILEDPAHGD